MLSFDTKQTNSFGSRRLWFFFLNLLCCFLFLNWIWLFYTHVFIIIHTIGYSNNLRRAINTSSIMLSQIHCNIALSTMTLYMFSLVIMPFEVVPLVSNLSPKYSYLTRMISHNQFFRNLPMLLLKKNHAINLNSFFHELYEILNNNKSSLLVGRAGDPKPILFLLIEGTEVPKVPWSPKILTFHPLWIFFP